MESLVLQLQCDCLDPNISVSAILRKALVVARKLSLSDAEAWIEKELNGYKGVDTVPPHRVVRGSIKSYHSYHGWRSIIFTEDTEAAESLSECFCGQSIGALEELIKGTADYLLFPFHPEIERQIMSRLSDRSQPTRHITRASLAGIIDATRNMVLDWSLKLERDGILGEGMRFNDKEKETASHASYNITYNGPVGNSQIQQGTDYSKQSMSITGVDLKTVNEFIVALNGHMAELKLETTESLQLQAEVSTVQTQLKSPRPNHFILLESLRSIRNILEGCVGSLLATGLIAEINKLLPS